MRLSAQQVRLAARSLLRQRGFAVVAILSLALAIALNTTMFSVLDAMINPRLDIRDPDQLYMLSIWGDVRHQVNDATRASLLSAGFKTYEAASYHARSGSLSTSVEYARRYTQIAPAVVAPNFFQVLGTHPLAGRVFVNDDFTGDTRVAVMSQRLAATLSPDKPFPVGDVIDLDDGPVRVIGIVPMAAMPPVFDGEDLWLLPPATTPLAQLPINLVRLRSGEARAQAEAEIKLIEGRFAALAGVGPKDIWFQLLPVSRSKFQFLAFHYALISSVIAVLLIACANLANLQLARGIGRSRELALRTALGASRRDIILQLVVESTLLTVAGLVIGLVLTLWGVSLLSAHIPKSVGEYFVAPQISWRVLGFAAMASVFCTLIIGLIPAIRVSRVDPNELMKSGAGTGAHRRSRRQYGVMIAVELGLALAVLSGAAIVVRTAAQVHAADDTFDLRPLSAGYAFFRPDRDSTVALAGLMNSMVSRLRSIDDAKDAAVELFEHVAGDAVTVDERGGTPHEFAAPLGTYKAVSPAYLRTFGRPIVKGRDFLEGTPNAPEVIVDEHTAKALWQSADPIGAQIKLGAYASDAGWARVVGVVRDFKDPRAVERLVYEPEPGPRQLGDIFYLPSAHDVISLKATRSFMQLLVRAKTDPERLPISMARVLPRGGLIRFSQITTLERSWGLVRNRERHDFIAAVFTLFAALAVGLAALGIYGIVAHSVAERRRELGVRIALGATAKHIIHTVIREGNPVALAGVAIGLYFTKQSVLWLHAFSFEGDENDALLFAAVAATLFLVAVISAIVPALRATRIDPVESLRSE